MEDNSRLNKVVDLNFFYHVEKAEVINLKMNMLFNDEQAV